MRPNGMGSCGSRSSIRPFKTDVMIENDPNNNPIFQPQTSANKKLRQDVAPPDWVNPEPADKYNLVVIGAGSGGLVTEFSKAVIATGGRAIVLPIPGLEEAGALTNETLFSLTERPKRFAVIGAGPIGCEMAQAFARLGSEVTLFEKECKILQREDADAAKIVEGALERDGVRLICDADIEKVERNGDLRTVHLKHEGEKKQWEFDHILVGVGRAPNVEGFVKVHTVKGKIVGATIVGEHAGDLISEISVAMQAGMKLGSLASVIHPYPTAAEAIRKLGDAYNRTRFTPFVAKLFRIWLKWTG